MSEHLFNVLILCTGNSARSILAEALLSRMGTGKFRAFSAGSFPKGKINPGAVRLLGRQGFDLSQFSSKSWNAFTGPGAPEIDLVITVCGNAAGEACPVFPGTPLRAHWGLSDPADASGSTAEVDAAFAETWRLLEMRIKALLEIDLGDPERVVTQRALAEIGAMEGAA
jgi:arsenate reductase